MSLGGTYSSAVEDWLLARQKPAKSAHNQFQLCDSVPDLSKSDGDFSGNNFIISAKHAIPTSLTPRKNPTRNGAFHTNNNHNNNNNNNNVSNNNFLTNGYEHSPRIQSANNSIKPNNNYGKLGSTTATANTTSIEYDNDNNEVQLRRNAINRNDSYKNKTNDKQNDWMYRRPTAPNDIRHSCKHLIRFPSLYV